MKICAIFIFLLTTFVALDSNLVYGRQFKVRVLNRSIRLKYDLQAVKWSCSEELKQCCADLQRKPEVLYAGMSQEDRKQCQQGGLIVGHTKDGAIKMVSCDPPQKVCLAVKEERGLWLILD